MSTSLITFKQLIDLIPTRLGAGVALSPKSLPNLLSALGALAAERDFPLGAPVGTYLRLSFYKTRNAHLEVLRAEGRSEDYIANRKYLLNAVHRLINTLDREEAALTGRETPLQRTLRELFAEFGVRPGARAIGIPEASLKRWIAGSVPATSAILHFKKIERYFGMVAGSLVNLLPSTARPTETAEEQEAPNEYCDRLRKQCNDPYLLKPNKVVPRYKTQWIKFFQYKTAATRSVGGLLDAGCPKEHTWSVRVPLKSTDPGIAWTDTIDGKYCATASITFQVFAAFIGYLERSVEKGGRGMSAQEAQNLAHLSNVELINDYLTFRIARTADIIGGTIDGFLVKAAMVCHPKHGFLVRTPEIGRSIGLETEKEWKAHLEEAHRRLRDAKKEIKPKLVKSRDPFREIKSVLALDNPMSAIRDMLERMDRQSANKREKKLAQAIRNKLAVELLASNPLRARNLKELTWKPDNTGTLRQDKGGAWRIVIRRIDFKNVRGYAKDHDYDSPVQPWAWRTIELYVRQYRSFLVADGCDLLFAADSNPRGVWMDFNRVFFRLTKKHLQGCKGASPHCMRHIVATTIIKRSPNGFVMAALVLHDHEETVRKHYAHLLPDDGARAMAEAFGGAFD